MIDWIPDRPGRVPIVRRGRPTERASLVLALLTIALGTVLSIVNSNNQIKVGGVSTIVIVVSSLVLGLRSMLVLCGAVVIALTVVFMTPNISPSPLSISGYLTISVAVVVALLQAHRRDSLGLREVSAETVLVQIRDRLAVQSQLPEIPDDWTVQVEQRPADGAAICGDFVATRIIDDGDRPVLHLAVIDVSGSGIAAGPRSLLLSGAVGGLLGSVEPEQFLPSANDYVIRQQWSLGFASAVYLVLDLTTGDYAIRIAGHPPAVIYRPDVSPAWHTSAASGTVLGVIGALSGTTEAGRLGPGESLYLFTDGLVESRSQTMDDGLQRLRSAIESLGDRASWDDAASHLLDEVPSAATDDRTVVVIRRAPTLGALHGDGEALVANAQTPTKS